MKLQLFKVIPEIGSTCMGVMDFNSEEEKEKLEKQFSSYITKVCQNQ